MKELKAIKLFISVITVGAIFFASTAIVSAIGFDAEKAYDSVFVVRSGEWMGSGFAIGSNCIITNAHVIGDENSIYLTDYEGESFAAEIYDIDYKKDIAILSVSDAKFTALELIGYDSIKTGDDIYAIGAPNSMTYTLTKGVISSKKRDVDGATYIQIDAAINEGNSGGPLLNDKGQAIGMNTLKLSASEGIGMAIPADTMIAHIKSLGLEFKNDGSLEDVDGESSGRESNLEGSKKSSDKGSSVKVPERGRSVFAIIAAIIAVLSLIGNIILFILLQKQKRKLKFQEIINSSKKEDEKISDFEIDIWE